MKKENSPSLIDQIGTPLFLMVSGGSAIIWFFYRVFLLIHNASSPVITFDKGSYYMLGVGIGLLSLAFMIIKEFWFNSPVTKQQNILLSRSAIAGVVIMLILPHITHFAADKYLENNGYTVCKEASHQWLFVRDIVYTRDPIVCSENLKSFNSN